MAAEFKAPQPPVKQQGDVQTSPSAAEPTVAEPELVIEPQPEIRRAELPVAPEVEAKNKTPDRRTGNDAAEKLFRTLLDSGSHETRAKMIAHPEDNRADMEGFFERNAVRLKSVQLAETQPVMIPGHETASLFQVVTDENRRGAWARLVVEGNSFLLDWPLFAETYERRLERYIARQHDQPSWFYVALRRAHALELPEAVRSQHVCFELRVGDDDSARMLATVSKETPLGRFFERELDWGSLYFARLLLQNRKFAEGLQGLLILDCEGAAAGSAVSSERKN